MHAQRPALLSRRHLGWLLWLVLLLPLAQTAASWHVLSHTRAEQSREDTPQGLHQERCDLCFSAATLFGGAPAGSAGPLPDSRARGDALDLAPRNGHLSVPLRAYDSRAPPFPTL